jgi:hypothetical protein
MADAQAAETRRRAQGTSHQTRASIATDGH